MLDARPRVLSAFPYPIAYPYSLIFEEADQASNRCWALCFTVYQVLRTVGLTLVSQYLREPIDERAHASVSAINRSISGIRSPHFSDWIALVETLRRHLDRVGIPSCFPELAGALDLLKTAEERRVGLQGSRQLAPLRAILALRNEIAHGGIPNQDEAEQHLAAFLPVLHQVLDAFDFLGDCLLVTCCEAEGAAQTEPTRIRTLRGAAPGPETLEHLPDTLRDAFAESSAVLLRPPAVSVPLYPLFHPVSAHEPLFLYDGHYSTRVQTRQGPEERSYIYYLGIHHRATDGPSCDRLRALLARRQISFFLEKAATAPWTLADSAADYSRRTLAELLGTKYFPECYLPFDELERHFDSFLRVPEPGKWSKDTTHRRYVNGFLLIGRAGAGKTAFLARQVERLLASAQDEGGDRDHPNLVLFLRGNGIALRPEGISLFRDLAEKLGLAVEGTAFKERSHGGFSSFRELLDHLHQRWQQDKVPRRRLILILDAVNEAAFAQQIVREALDMVGVAACYPWCKMVLSTRQEWLALWSGKMGAQETSLLAELRASLYTLEQAGREADSPPPGGATGRTAEGTRSQGPPVITIEPLTEAQAGPIYERYRASARADGAAAYAIPACRTPWTELAEPTRALLSNPLYVHLFMESFNGWPAQGVTAVPRLFQRYVERCLEERPALRASVTAVLEHLLHNPNRPSADLGDDDANAIRRRWADALSAEEARLTLSPLEGLTHEGFVTKRVREEGGGYRFVFQQVAEYLIFRHFQEQRPAGQDEGAYWLRRAEPASVFAEYAGAFGFLFRDWSARDQVEKAGPLVEAGAPWLWEVHVVFLLDQALVGYQPGRTSRAAELAAEALARTGGARCAAALLEAGRQLMNQPLVGAAATYLDRGSTCLHALLDHDPANATVARTLARGLIDRGTLAARLGRKPDAIAAFRRVIALCEGGRDVEAAQLLGTAFERLGGTLASLDSAEAREEGRQASARSVRICQKLFYAHPRDLDIAGAYGTALLGETGFLVDAGRQRDAMVPCRMAVELYGALWERRPGNPVIGEGYSKALYNLAVLRAGGKRWRLAGDAIRRAVQIAETLWTANPGNSVIGGWYAQVLRWLAGFLARWGRQQEVQRIQERCREVESFLWEVSPENVENAVQLCRTLVSQGRAQEARRVLDDVLARVPENPEALRLQREWEQRVWEERSVQPTFPLWSLREPGLVRRGLRRIVELVLDPRSWLPRLFAPVVVTVVSASVAYALSPLSNDATRLPLAIAALVLIALSWAASALEPDDPWSYLSAPGLLRRARSAGRRRHWRGLLDRGRMLMRHLEYASSRMLLFAGRFLLVLGALLLHAIPIFIVAAVWVEGGTIGILVDSGLLLAAVVVVWYLGPRRVGTWLAQLVRDQWHETPAGSPLIVRLWQTGSGLVLRSARAHLMVAYGLVIATGTVGAVSTILLILAGVVIALWDVLGLWGSILGLGTLIVAIVFLVRRSKKRVQGPGDGLAEEEPLPDDPDAPAGLLRRTFWRRITLERSGRVAWTVLRFCLILAWGAMLGAVGLLVLELIGALCWLAFDKGSWLTGILLTVLLFLPVAFFCLVTAFCWIAERFGWVPHIRPLFRDLLRFLQRTIRLSRFQRAIKVLRQGSRTRKDAARPERERGRLPMEGESPRTLPQTWKAAPLATLPHSGSGDWFAPLPSTPSEAGAGQLAEPAAANASVADALAREARAHNERGVSRAKSGDWAGARAEFDRAIQLKPDFAVAYLNRGYVRYKTQDNDGALADLDQAAALNPADPVVYYWRGNAYYNKGDLDRALADFDRAVAAGADDAEALFARGFVRLRKDDAPGAVADLSRSIALRPTDSLSYFWRGSAYMKLSEIERAIADFDRAIELDGTLADAYFNRGYCRMAVRDYRRAITNFSQAIALNASDGGAYHQRGNAYYSQGDYTRAVADYEQALRLQPDAPLLYYRRALAHAALGERDQALADLEHVLEASKDAQLLHEAKVQMQNLRQQRPDAS